MGDGMNRLQLPGILIVDDEESIRHVIRLYLQNAGFVVYEAADGEEALELFYAKPIQLVVLDLLLPGINGIELCTEMREERPDLPILMVTALRDRWDRLVGFRKGADDYVTKPFDPDELVLRVIALLRRSGIVSNNELTFGPLQILAERRVVIISGVEQVLPQKELELLSYLASHPGVVCSRDTLIQSVWGIEFNGDERTLDVHVKRLRERLRPISNDVAIVTLRGVGYRFEVVGS